VGVLVGVEEASILSPGGLRLYAGERGLAEGGPGEGFWVRADAKGVSVYDRGGLLESGLSHVRILPAREGGEVTVNGAGYPGTVEAFPSPRQGLNVVNEVGLETYLRGVVPREIAHRSPQDLEAAKAQAVAARTYTVAHLGQYPGEGFDLEAGVRDQVYSGVTGRHPEADRAVSETAGLVILYEGKPIRANYASTCGGRTAGVEESFEHAPIPYLKSHEDRLGSEIACRASKYYRWEEVWTAEDLLRVLSRTVPAVLGQEWRGKRVLDVRVEERGGSGRAVRIRIRTDEASYEATKGAIRRVLELPGGRGPLWSTAFELVPTMRSGRLTQLAAKGQGWGHGVGMCQWGAMQLSREGQSFREILAHYYPDTKIARWTADGRTTD
jgi:stage II sporulation protein D